MTKNADESISSSCAQQYGSQHLRPVNQPATNITYCSGFANGNIRTAFGLSIAEAHPYLAADTPGNTSA